MQYADVIVNIVCEELDRCFQYRVPEHLEGELKVGMGVMIPFGKSDRLIKGYCVALGEECKFDPAKTKEIAKIVQNDSDGDGRSVALAAWIRENYGSTMIQALKTVLPMRKSVKQLEHQVLVCTATKEELIAMLGESQRKHQVAKARLLEALIEEERIPKEWVTGKLSVASATIHSLERAGALKIQSTNSFRDPVKVQAGEERKKTLSEDQERIGEA